MTAKAASAKGVDQAPVAAALPAATLRPAQAAPRTRSQTKGLSMTSMLQTRSEAAVAASRRLCPSPLPDIDAIDRANPLAMAEYVNDIHSYYKRAEPKYRVEPTYMKKQVRGTWSIEPCHSLIMPSAPMYQTLNHACNTYLQADINEKMRAILIDWLVEVHLKFKVQVRVAHWTLWGPMRKSSASCMHSYLSLNCSSPPRSSCPRPCS